MSHDDATRGPVVFAVERANACLEVVRGEARSADSALGTELAEGGEYLVGAKLRRIGELEDEERHRAAVEVEDVVLLLELLEVLADAGFAVLPHAEVDNGAVAV